MNEPALPARWLVLGASGQVGHFLLRRLGGQDVVALSRHAPPAWARALPGVRFVEGDLFRRAALPAADTIIGAGPLDGLAAWLEQCDPPAPRRLVALSSTSVQTKESSTDPNERALVARLKLAEETVEAWCTRQGTGWTLLRPTLIYGCGLDRSLSAIARRARAIGFYPLPRGAGGLRQPVHADDVAAACLAAAQADAAVGRIYALPGGETLAFDEMIARVLGCLDPPPRAIELPGRLLKPAFALARRLASFGLPRLAAVARMDRDLVFDDSAARRDFGYAPRGFAPAPAMFERPALEGSG